MEHSITMKYNTSISHGIEFNLGNGKYHSLSFSTLPDRVDLFLNKESLSLYLYEYANFKNSDINIKRKKKEMFSSENKAFVKKDKLLKLNNNEFSLLKSMRHTKRKNEGISLYVTNICGTGSLDSTFYVDIPNHKRNIHSFKEVFVAQYNKNLHRIEDAKFISYNPSYIFKFDPVRIKDEYENKYPTMINEYLSMGTENINMFINNFNKTLNHKLPEVLKNELILIDRHKTKVNKLLTESFIHINVPQIFKINDIKTSLRDSNLHYDYMNYFLYNKAPNVFANAFLSVKNGLSNNMNINNEWSFVGNNYNEIHHIEAYVGFDVDIGSKKIITDDYIQAGLVNKGLYYLDYNGISLENADLNINYNENTVRSELANRMLNINNLSFLGHIRSDEIQINKDFIEIGKYYHGIFETDVVNLLRSSVKFNINKNNEFLFRKSKKLFKSYEQVLLSKEIVPMHSNFYISLWRQMFETTVNHMNEFASNIDKTVNVYDKMVRLDYAWKRPIYINENVNVDLYNKGVNLYDVDSLLTKNHVGIRMGDLFTLYKYAEPIRINEINVNLDLAQKGIEINDYYKTADKYHKGITREDGLFIDKKPIGINLRDDTFVMGKGYKPIFFIYNNTWVNKNRHSFSMICEYTWISKNRHDSSIIYDYTWVNKNSHESYIIYDYNWISKNEHDSSIMYDYTWISKNKHDLSIIYDYTWLNKNNHDSSKIYYYPWILKNKHDSSIIYYYTWINKNNHGSSMVYDNPWISKNKHDSSIIYDYTWLNKNRNDLSMMYDYTWLNKNKHDSSMIYDNPWISKNKHDSSIIYDYTWVNKNKHDSSMIYDNPWISKNKHDSSIIYDYTWINKNKHDSSIIYDNPWISKNKHDSSIIYDYTWINKNKHDSSIIYDNPWISKNEHDSYIICDYPWLNKNKHDSSIIYDNPWISKNEHDSYIICDYPWLNKNKHDLSINYDYPWISKNEHESSMIYDYSWLNKNRHDSSMIYDYPWISKNEHESSINYDYRWLNKNKHDSSINYDYPWISKNRHESSINYDYPWLNKNRHDSSMIYENQFVDKSMEDIYMNYYMLNVDKDSKGIYMDYYILNLDKDSKGVYMDKNMQIDKFSKRIRFNNNLTVNQDVKGIGTEKDFFIGHYSRPIDTTKIGIRVSHDSRKIRNEEIEFIDVDSKAMEELKQIFVREYNRGILIEKEIILEEESREIWFDNYRKDFEVKKKTGRTSIEDDVRLNNSMLHGNLDYQVENVSKGKKDTYLPEQYNFVEVIPYDPDNPPVKPPVLMSGKIDELILPHKDYTYSNFVKKLIYDDGSINWTYVKNYDSKTGEYTVSIPIENPMTVYANIGRNYLDIDVAILEIVIYLVKTVWKDNMYKYIALSAQDSLKHLMVEVDKLLIVYGLNKEQRKEAERCMQLFRWYAEMAVLNNCEYILKFDTKKISVDYYNKDLGNFKDIITFDNMEITDNYIIEPIDETKTCSITFKNNNINPNLPLNLSFRLYNINTTSSISIIGNDSTKSSKSYSQGVHDITAELENRVVVRYFPSDKHQSINIANVIIDNKSIRGFTVRYKGKFGETNTVMQNLLDSMLVVGEASEELKQKLSDVSPVTVAISTMVKYFKLHHENKLKGKRLITKK